MDLSKFDFQHIWHPCTQMKDHEDFPIIPIKKAKGVWLYDYYGNKILDAISSWWVNILGHSNERINNAIKKQLSDFEHIIFAGFTHEPAIKLTEMLMEITPDNLTKLFFADNGSSAVEVAIKMSFHYWQLAGNKEKKYFASISGAYHGETIGALSVGDIDLYKKIYKPLLFKTFTAEGPNCFRCKYKKNRESCDAECFESMEDILKNNSEEICGVIIEPMVQCANGMNIYSKEYLIKLYNACKKYNVHLIVDEIAVGFGRTGKMFAIEHAKIKPDFMCLSKGITGGYLSLSVVFTTDKIYEAFYDDYTTLKAFLHSHSYTGNALACAAGKEVLTIFKDEDILEKNKEKSKILWELLNQYFFNHPNIGEIRQIGMISALEIVKDKEKKENFPWEKRIGFNIYKEAIKNGALLRPLGDVIYFMPPYVINEDEIEFMVKVAYKSINKVLESQ